jgi:glycosyltransferase involved in cell wall biosynthesis
VDGLEWRRAKWSGLGKAYYRLAEQMSVRWSDALIADAAGIAAYYREEFDADTVQIAYGTRLASAQSVDRIAERGLTPGGYHLVVARFEPENHVDMIVEGYVRSGATLPLVVVGSTPYSQEYDRRVRSAADSRVRFLGGVWDGELLDGLYAGSLTYLHGHSVGGTNPSLLRAMGAGTAVLAYDVVFNREVLDAAGRYFRDAADVAALVEQAEADPTAMAALGQRAATEVRRYDWDDVTDRYEALARELPALRARGRRPSGRRAKAAGSRA